MLPFAHSVSGGTAQPPKVVHFVHVFSVLHGGYYFKGRDSMSWVYIAQDYVLEPRATAVVHACLMAFVLVGARRRHELVRVNCAVVAGTTTSVPHDRACAGDDPWWWGRWGCGCRYSGGWLVATVSRFTRVQ